MGLCKELVDQSVAMTEAGSRMYFSPEILNKQPYKYSTDVFSLGLILYELCTFECFMTPQMLNTVYSKQELDIPDLGPEYANTQRILEDVLVLNPEERINVKQIVKKIDRAYPDLKPKPAKKAAPQQSDARLQEMEQKSRALELKV